MNAINEKAAYLAQYWGQSVISDVDNSGARHLYPVAYSNMYRIEESHLELTPLSAITDEDAIEVAKIAYKQNTNRTAREGRLYVGDNFTYDKATRPVSTLMYVVDYLRSKGYALPFRNYSVEQLIEMGWLKLKEEK